MALKTIGMLVLALIGLAMFLWGVNEIRKRSAGENILEVVFDVILGEFFSSPIWIILLGLVMMMIGISGIIK